MIIRPDVVARLDSLGAVTAVPAVPDSTHDPSALTPGARVQARVEAQLAGGGFKVLVSDILMHMQLPPGVRPGAMLDLMYISDKPRPTFLLLNPSAASGSNASLSPAAHLLNVLAQTAKTGAMTPPYQATPVLEEPPGDTGEFGTRLQQAFSRSGLFYEAHQAQWLVGHRTHEQLLQEPQGRLSTSMPQGRPAPVPQGRLPALMLPGQLPAAMLPGQLPAAMPQVQLPAAMPQGQPPSTIPQGQLPAPMPQSQPPAAMPQVQLQVAALYGRTDAPGSALPSQARAQDAPPPAALAAIEHAIHKDALPLVQQQLAALDTGQMLWRGEIWPGQTLDWEVGSEPPAQDTGEAPARWHSRLRLTLPRMGEITALIVLDPGGVRIAMSAADASAVEMLRGGQASLAQSMQRSGLNVNGIEVQYSDGA